MAGDHDNPNSREGVASKRNIEDDAEEGEQAQRKKQRDEENQNEPAEDQHKRSIEESEGGSKSERNWKKKKLSWLKSIKLVV